MSTTVATIRRAIFFASACFGMALGGCGTSPEMAAAAEVRVRHEGAFDRAEAAELNASRLGLLPRTWYPDVLVQLERLRFDYDCFGDRCVIGADIIVTNREEAALTESCIERLAREVMPEGDWEIAGLDTRFKVQYPRVDCIHWRPLPAEAAADAPQSRRFAVNRVMSIPRPANLHANGAYKIRLTNSEIYDLIVCGFDARP